MARVMNLGRLLTHTARLYPDRPAIVWRGEQWSWTEVTRRVDALVAALRKLGVEKGDRILLQSRNGNRLFESAWASFQVGAAWTPVNFRLAPQEVRVLAEVAAPRVMIYDAPFAAHADAVASGAESLEHVVAMADARPGEHDYEALIATHADAGEHVAAVEPDDPAWLFFTSGTTGRPKAATLTHAQLAFILNNHIADLAPGLTADDPALTIGPLSHNTGLHMLMSVARGAATVMLPEAGLDEAEAWRLVEAHRITNLSTVPTILKRLVNHPAVDRYDHSSLRYVIYAGEPLYREDQKRALRKLGTVLVQKYGLAEVAGNITVLPAHMHSLDDGEMPVGSCGYARTGMDVVVLDTAGAPVPAGEAGEVCVRGPAVFAGYFNDPERSAEVSRDGWFHTGDIGRLDGSGFLYLTGRGSDMYISGGHNVHPHDAEAVLLQHPDVREAAVLGVPDPKWGESGVAVVVRGDGAATSADDLYGWFDGRLAKYKWPRRIVFWSALPKTAYGKTPKRLLREELAARGELPAMDGG
jgi:fatty-acyl-CoA synthase